jgi:hypothetical protein
MLEKQIKDLQPDAALEGLDDELSVTELTGVAGGTSTKRDFKGLSGNIWSEEPPDNIAGARTSSPK